MSNIGLPELMVILIILAGMAFWIWMLIECVTQEPANNERIVWTIIIVVAHFIGAAIYFFVRRPQRKALNKSS
jgi:uncharacterized membrane protein